MDNAFTVCWCATYVRACKRTPVPRLHYVSFAVKYKCWYIYNKSIFRQKKHLFAHFNFLQACALPNPISENRKVLSNCWISRLTDRRRFSSRQTPSIQGHSEIVCKPSTLFFSVFVLWKLIVIGLHIAYCKLECDINFLPMHTTRTGKFKLAYIIKRIFWLIAQTEEEYWNNKYMVSHK